MAECDFCGEEFENTARLHYHWGEEHEDELNSHQKEKVKKARRKKEEEKQEITARRKKLAGYGLFGTLTILVVGFLALQVLPTLVAGPDQQEEFPLDDRPVLGEEDANVTIVEFGDYLCPYCADFEFQVKDRLEDEGYFDEDGGVNFYYLHFPVAGGENEAVAAECVAEQDHDAFWDFHNALFQESNIGSLTDLAEAETEGLDYEELEQCIDNRETIDIVNRDQEVGYQNEVSGTPTVFINGQNVPNALDYAQIESMIEQELD